MGRVERVVTLRNCRYRNFARVMCLWPVEAMSIRFPARGWNWAGAAEFGESSLGTDAFGIVPDEDEHLSCSTRGDPMGFEHGRRAGYGQSLEIGIMGSDFGIKRQPASRECPQGSLGRGRCRDNRLQAWLEGSQVADQRHLADDLVERLAQGCRCVDDDGLECDHGLCSALHGSVARHLQVPDHLDRAVG